MIDRKGTALSSTESAADDEIWTRRDAETTRRLLVRAARKRFAQDGYRATTVRTISADAGVNVALINRYFGSKDGLFEACLRETVTGFAPISEDPPVGLDELVSRLLSYVIESPSADAALQLLLLVRSSGDDRADELRRTTLETFTRRLVEVAGLAHDGEEESTMRAQVAIATLLGIAMVRTSTGLEPVTSALPDALEPPLRQVLTYLLETPHGTSARPA